MNETQFFLELIKIYGPAGIIVGYVILELLKSMRAKNNSSAERPSSPSTIIIKELAEIRRTQDALVTSCNNLNSKVDVMKALMDVNAARKEN